MAFIEVQDLRKQFVIRKKKETGKLIRERQVVPALLGVSFQIARGELVGYIGPNGAGKSTTVKILSGILTPDGGEVAIGGRIPWKNRSEHVRRIGVVFGQRSQLWWDVPIADSFELLKDIYRIPGSDFTPRLKELSEALQIEPLMRTPLRLLSLGQRMRAELCGSLLHSPELLFLDEPTIGLDAVSKLALRDFLRWENQNRGTTILLTTHDMEDVSAICSRVMVLGHGQKLYDGSMPDLLSRYDTRRIMTLRRPRTEIPLPALPEGCTMETRGEELIITYPQHEVETAALIALLQQAGPIGEMTIQPQSVDHLIARMYQEMEL